jgi:hypothetical protein
MGVHSSSTLQRICPIDACHPSNCIVSYAHIRIAERSGQPTLRESSPSYPQTEPNARWGRSGSIRTCHSQCHSCTICSACCRPQASHCRILGDAMRTLAWRCARRCAVLCSMLSICAATVDQCSDGVCPDVPTSGEADAPLFQWDPIKVSYAQLACCGQQSGHLSMRRLGTCADCVWKGVNWS